MAFTTPALKIARPHWQQIVSHLRNVHPQEGCGLLAGLSGRSRAVLPVTNQLRSPTRFFMEPIELLQALEKIDRQGWELQAIFHSHPGGPHLPSSRDLEEYRYPDTPALICYPVQPGRPEKDWDCRAYQISDQQYRSIEIQVLD